MIDRIINGVIGNWELVAISLVMLIGGSIAAYRKHGLKRVLLGKKNDNRELLYRKQGGEINWKETLKTWWIIITGGMSLLSIFLIAMVLILGFVYAHDIQATRDNDAKMCALFGTTTPTTDQLEHYYGVDLNGEIDFSKINLSGGGE